MKPFTKSDWVILIGVTLIVVLVHNFEFEKFLTRTLQFPDGDAPAGGPGDDRPFYFVRQHAMSGLCAGIAMCLALVLVAATWKRYRRASSLAFFLAWIWCMPYAVEGLIIWWRCPHLMDPRRAVSAWPTFNAWINDPLRWMAFLVTLVLGVGWGILFRKVFKTPPPGEFTQPMA
jgi:hypothetical protein